MIRLVAALLIVGFTAMAIHSIAERKNREVAGPGAHPLQQGPEREAFDSLLSKLERLDQADFAERLRELHAEGRFWVAPALPEGRQALYVNSLNLVERVYVDRNALLLDELPFPDSRVPHDWQRLYSLLRLGGTLYHEVQHLDGVLDESVAYERELVWYASVAATDYVAALEPRERRRYAWALESTVLSVQKAAEKAGGQASIQDVPSP